jgi:pimeloyl-ACP methyl ester carboxylesterase
MSGEFISPGDQFTKSTVKTASYTLTYHESGAGPTVVFVHGSTGPEPSIGKDILARSHRVIELEQPGFGNSPDDDALMSYADLAETVAAAIAELPVPQYHVVGSSLGGITALHLAVAHPDRVQSLTLEASMAFLGDAFARPTDEQWSYLRAFSENPDIPAPPFPPHPRKPWEDTERIRDQFRRRLRVVQQPRYYVEAFDESLAVATARSIKVPTQVLFGTVDPFITPGMLDVVAANYRRALPNAAFTLVDGAGHDIQGEAPEQFASAVAELISQSS